MVLHGLIEFNDAVEGQELLHNILRQVLLSFNIKVGLSIICFHIEQLKLYQFIVFKVDLVKLNVVLAGGLTRNKEDFGVESLNGAEQDELIILFPSLSELVLKLTLFLKAFALYVNV